MPAEVTNHFKYHLGYGDVNIRTDAFKIILMDSGFTFDKDAHEDYADVSGSELNTAYGYTVKTKALAGVNLSEDDTNDRLSVTWNNVTWTASGGDIGPTPGAIVIDDTQADDVVVGYIPFGGDQMAVDGATGTIANVEFRIA